MTSGTDQRAGSLNAVTATWLFSAAELLPVNEAWHVTTSPAWAAAWARVRTEVIRSTRILHLRDGHRSDAVWCYLVEKSPYWTRHEREAGVGPVWPGPVLYAGCSCYALYGGAGGASDSMVAAAVDHGLDLARRWQACALVFPNLPPALFHRWHTVRPPSEAVLLDYAYSGGVDDFLAAIPAGVRSELGRQRRRASDAGLRVRAVSGSHLRWVVDDFTRLATATAERHGYNFLGRDIIEATRTVPGAVLLAAEHEGELVGGILCFRYGTHLYSWLTGVDYRRLRTLNTYAALLGARVEYAEETGATVLHAGRGNHADHRRLGLTGVPLQACVYLTRPDPDLQARLSNLDARQQARNRAADPTVSWQRP